MAFAFPLYWVARERGAMERTYLRPSRRRAVIVYGCLQAVCEFAHWLVYDSARKNRVRRLSWQV